MAVDGSGNAYVAGYTNSTNFPTVSPYDGSFNGIDDVFVTKLDASGSGLVYSTYLGGSSYDYGVTA
ncbi:MAG: SBBP repeat-containing protein [Candidatus Brocadia sinica]|nr:SBBP repeat-containing protein [Candidatus Brocadia sinica]